LDYFVETLILVLPGWWHLTEVGEGIGFIARNGIPSGSAVANDVEGLKLTGQQVWFGKRG
jgi:hypothetical protein